MIGSGSCCRASTTQLSLAMNGSSRYAGSVTIDTIGSSFDTTLGVYTGTSVSALTLVGGDDDSAGNQKSRVTFSAASGTVYRIAVDGYNGATGSVVITWGQSSGPPANDTFSAATALSGASGNST